MFITHEILIWNHNSAGENHGKHHGNNLRFWYSGNTRNFVKHESSHTTKLARTIWSMFIAHEILIWIHNFGRREWWETPWWQSRRPRSTGKQHFCETCEFTYHKMTRQIWSMLIIHEHLIWNHFCLEAQMKQHMMEVISGVGSHTKCWKPWRHPCTPHTNTLQLYVCS